MRINPVFIKELKVKARSWRFPIGISVFILFILMFMIMMLNEVVFSNNFKWGIRLMEFRNLYMFLFAFLLVIISIIVPSTASNAICGEKSRETFDLLVSSKLNIASIVFGKLMATISHTIVLLFVSLPFFALFFVIGVVNINYILLLFFYYIIYALLCGSIGLFYSTICKSSVASAISTYVTGLTITLFNLLFVITMYSRIGNNEYLDNFLSFLMHLNPLTGFGMIIELQFNQEVIKSIFTTLGRYYNVYSVLGVNILITIAISVVLLSITIYLNNPYRFTQKRK